MKRFITGFAIFCASIFGSNAQIIKNEWFVLKNFKEEIVKDPNQAYFILQVTRNDDRFNVKMYTRSERLYAEFQTLDSLTTIREGNAKFYDFYGNLKNTIHYLNGVKDGTAYCFKNNNIIDSNIYKNDFLIGKGQYYNVNNNHVDYFYDFNEFGTGIKKLNYEGTIPVDVQYTNGKIAESFTIHSSKSIGSSKVEVKDGKIEKVTYTDNKGNINAYDKDTDLFQYPQFQNGVLGWKSFLEKKLKYPKQLIKERVEGLVVIKFLVNEKGVVSDLEIIESAHPLLSEEVVRIFSLSPNWIPGYVYGLPVPKWHTQPITFKL